MLIFGGVSKVRIFAAVYLIYFGAFDDKTHF